MMVVPVVWSVDTVTSIFLLIYSTYHHYTIIVSNKNRITIKVMYCPIIVLLMLNNIFIRNTIKVSYHPMVFLLRYNVTHQEP